MKADPRFLRQPKEFWAHVRTISQEVGYTDRTTKAIRIPTLAQVRAEFNRLTLTTAHIADNSGRLTAFGELLFEYFGFRATVLNDTVQTLLMNKDTARVEFKEYYYTTTFGSRVADGVYETLLDGMELEELETIAQRKVHHLLVVDDHFTWWQSGRSYLCRIIDMLHMGFVDEVIFGREVLTRLPELAREWKATYEGLQASR